MITIPRKSLAAELVLLNVIAGNKATVIPVLNTVKLCFDGEALTMTASDCDVTAVTRISATGEPWEGCVPCGQLAALVRLLNVDELTLKPVDTRLEIHAGKARHRLPITAASEFPDTQLVDGKVFTLPLLQLFAAISATSFAMLELHDGVRPNEQKFTGLSLRIVGGVLEIMATRKVVTAIIETPAQGSLNTVIPRNAVEVLQRLTGETIAITSTENTVQFDIQHRTVIARSLMGEFPAWRDFLPPPRYTIQVKGSELRDAIRRASVTIGVDNAVGYEPMKVTWTSELASIETRGGERGHSLEPVAITSNLNGEPLAVGFVGELVLDVLAKCEGDVSCDLADEKSPMVFRDGKATYIVMPIGLRGW
jgi:DNA polymerase III sliding clamp (beta) subunit (PCNA family)